MQLHLILERMGLHACLPCTCSLSRIIYASCLRELIALKADNEKGKRPPRYFGTNYIHTVLLRVLECKMKTDRVMVAVNVYSRN